MKIIPRNHYPYIGMRFIVDLNGDKTSDLVFTVEEISGNMVYCSYNKDGGKAVDNLDQFITNLRSKYFIRV